MATPGLNASTGYQRQHLGRINTDLSALHSDSSDSLSPRSQEGGFRKEGMTKRATQLDSPTTNTPAGGPGAGAHEHDGGEYGGSGSPVLPSGEFAHNQPQPSSSRPRNGAGGSSPTLSRRGHSPLLPGFGFGFNSAHKPQKSTFSPGKRLVPRLLQSRSPLRNRLLAGLALACLVLWTVWGKSKPTIARERLTTRWWDADAAGTLGRAPLGDSAALGS